LKAGPLSRPQLSIRNLQSAAGEGRGEGKLWCSRPLVINFNFLEIP